MAAHREDVENRAVAVGEGAAVRERMKVFNGAEIGRALESTLSDLGAAIMSLVVERRCSVRCVLVEYDNVQP